MDDIVSKIMGEAAEDCIRAIERARGQGLSEETATAMGGEVIRLSVNCRIQQEMMRIQSLVKLPGGIKQ